jgi:hypothetical protein
MNSDAILAAGVLRLVPGTHISDIPELIVVVFGLLLWLSVLVALFCLAMRAIFGNQSRSEKRKPASRRP